MDTLRLYSMGMRACIRSQLQYRASFIMSSFGSFLSALLSFFAIWILFERFGSLGGFTLAEVALIYGITNVSFALADFFFHGFDHFSGMVRGGSFDRVLLRPRGTLIQVMMYSTDLLRATRMTQGLLVMTWGLLEMEVSMSMAKLALLMVAMVSGCLVFGGIFILQAVVTFWTIQTLEVFAVVTHGGMEVGSYPLNIFDKWFRDFFTYVIPLACTSYFPAILIMEKESVAPEWINAMGWTSPLCGLCFFAICTLIWKVGVRHYASTGS